MDGLVDAAGRAQSGLDGALDRGGAGLGVESLDDLVLPVADGRAQGGHEFGDRRALDGNAHHGCLGSGIVGIAGRNQPGKQENHTDENGTRCAHAINIHTEGRKEATGS